jgi:hypothetical protein
MEKVITAIEKKKWTAVVMLVLMGLLTLTAPLAASYGAQRGVKMAQAPLVAQMTELAGEVSEIKQSQHDEMEARAIAAYSKVHTVEDLVQNPQNATSIEIALKHPDVRRVLMRIDRDRTVAFEEYYLTQYNSMFPPEESPTPNG